MIFSLVIWRPLNPTYMDNYKEKTLQEAVEINS